MKKIILAVCVLASIVSCKKDKDKAATCDVTVAGITGSYKITKYVGVTTSGSVDLTSYAFDACELGGVYQLKADRTVVYTESGSSCTNSDIGSWDVVSGKISTSTGSLDFVNAAVANNCSTIVITEDAGSGSSFVTTLTK
jgi:hypothetical protein